MKNINHALTFIKRSPTGDNAQPWEIKIEENKVYFYYNSERGIHPYNKNHSADKIAIGFLKEYINEASSIMDFRYEFKELGNYNFLLKFQTEPNDIDYSDHPYFLRRTDRRHFSTHASLTEEDKKSIHSDKILSSKDFSPEFKKFYKASERRFWTTTDVIKYFVKWIHFSKRSYLKHKDGIYFVDLGIKYRDIVSVFLLKFIPQVGAFILRSPMFFMVYYQVRGYYKNTTFLFYYIDPEATDVNDQSAKILKDWAYLQSKGYAYHPMNLLSLPLYDDMLNHKLKCNKKSYEKVKQLQKILGTDKYILWTARVGKHEEPYPYKPSLRK